MDTNMKSVIDGGQNKFDIHFKVPTKNLAPNETTLTHIPGDQIKQAMKLADMDLLNPTHIELSVHAPMNNILGVSLSHGEDGDIPLSTHNRALLVDHEKESSFGYHSISTGARVAPIHTLTLAASEEQRKENSGIVLKRIDPKWMGMGPENAVAGAFKTKIDGQDKILVSDQSTAGVPSAVHRFLVHNETNAKLFNGAYTKSKVKTTLAPNGRSAFIMEPAHYNDTSASLKKSLTTTSPFKHGLTAAITNLSDQTIKSEQPSFVNVSIHRTPIDRQQGYVSRDDSVIAQHDVHALTGAVGSSGVKVAPLPYTEATEMNFDDLDAVTGGDTA